MRNYDPVEMVGTVLTVNNVGKLSPSKLFIYPTERGIAFDGSADAPAVKEFPLTQSGYSHDLQIALQMLGGLNYRVRHAAEKVLVTRE